MSFRSDIQESSKNIRECLRDIREAMNDGDRVHAYRIAQELRSEAAHLEYILRCAANDGTITATVLTDDALDRIGEILTKSSLVDLVNN